MNCQACGQPASAHVCPTNWTSAEERLPDRVDTLCLVTLRRGEDPVLATICEWGHNTNGTGAARWRKHDPTLLQLEEEPTWPTAGTWWMLCPFLSAVEPMPEAGTPMPEAGTEEGP